MAATQADDTHSCKKAGLIFEESPFSGIWGGASRGKNKPDGRMDHNKDQQVTITL
jgi:hypothetical protein